MTPVSMLLTDAFSHHDACFYYCFNASRRCVFLTWRLLQCFSEMHFPIMTPVSIIIRDAISYHDACFYYSQRCIFLSWRLFQCFSEMHFPIMTPVSIILRDAFSYNDACFYYFHRCIFLSWRLFLLFSQMHFLSWRLFLLFSEMHFPIMTLVYILFADALFYHDLGLILADVLFRSCVVIDKGCLSGSVWLRQDGATSKGWLRTRALSNS